MDDPNRITLDLDGDELAELAAIADHEERSISEVAADAVRARLTRNRAYVESVERGLADIRAGRTVSHEELLAHRAEQRRRYLAEPKG